VVVGRLIDASPPALVLVAVLAAERILELALTRARLRNRRGTATHGTLEWSALVAVHVGLLVLPPLEATWLGTRAPAPLLWSAIGVTVLAQLLRYWSIVSLGQAWNARAVVDPALAVVERGPYRWVRHPNYAAVFLEFAALPLAFGAWRSWLLLNVLHAPLIARRIRGEEALLHRIPGYQERMEAKGRFLPRSSGRNV